MARDSIYLYSPSTALAGVVAAIYFIPMVVLTWQTFFKYRSWFFLCVQIAAVLEVAGYIARVVSTKKQSDVPAYAVSSSLIVIAPVFVAAGNYLLIGRLIRAVLPTSRHRIFLIPARFITRTFVILDILAFNVQVSGTSLASSVNWVGDLAETGTNIIIGGLALQVATFCWFLCIAIRFWWCARREIADDAPAGWIKVMQAIWISSSLVLLRSVYRLIEFGLGIEGYPFTHEWIFYVFEALPMLPAIAVFCFVHPAKYLGNNGHIGKGTRLDESQTELRQDMSRSKA
ncbi:RTA1 like protein [Aaosphaeria arxii CBS 175.79]|uniref:RTA1 like protein n=1 Tax=Aaosphaeria arxii CBS 175.79 TaxID=1450172 RepID=A0A6A5XXW4_9PLEO|nr:RTA1 like protein [Aaosphaeria arxii CBS 175.79]KAF2018148.1 RTA1 like protein [Aaosphaeria arxii CBS 175.79]